MRSLLLAVLSGLAFADEPVRLSDFARSHRLAVTRDAATGRDILRGGSTVVLAPGLSVAIVDGTAVALSTPVRIENGRSVLSPDDAARLGRFVREAPALPEEPPPVEVKAEPVRPLKPPVVKAAPSPKKGRFRTIVLDPGHGGVHQGYIGQLGTREKDIVLEVSLTIRELLQAEGIRVVMTRETDRHLAPLVRDDLDERVDLTNRVNPDLFLSIHANGADNKSAKGFEVFYPRADCAAGASDRAAGRRLADKVRQVFAERFDTPDRGVKEAGFFVIRNAKCPAVLVELEFVSNVSAERKLKESSYRKRLAEAVVEAVLREHRR